MLLQVRGDDVSGGFATYQIAVADEVLSKAQRERAQELYQHGALALNDMQIADDTEKKAKIAVDVAAKHLKLTGSTVEQPESSTLSLQLRVLSPTNAAGV